MGRHRFGCALQLFRNSPGWGVSPFRRSDHGPQRDELRLDSELNSRFLLHGHDEVSGNANAYSRRRRAWELIPQQQERVRSWGDRRGVPGPERDETWLRDADALGGGVRSTIGSHRGPAFNEQHFERHSERGGVHWGLSRRWNSRGHRDWRCGGDRALRVTVVLSHSTPERAEQRTSAETQHGHHWRGQAAGPS